MTPTTRIERYRSASRFLADAGVFLLAREVEHNLILGVAHALARSEGLDGASLPSAPAARGAVQTGASDPWFLVARRGPAVVGAAMCTPPHRVVLTRASSEVVESLVEHCLLHEAVLPGVNGPEPGARDFAESYVRSTAGKARPGRSMRIFQLDAVTDPADRPGGGMRTVAEPDLPLLEEWITAFGQDVGEAVRDARRSAQEGVRWGSLVLWDEDGVPRSMAARARPTPNGCGVNLVYTPPRYRGRGYASALVADLSRSLLDAGFQFCFLYTDLANPTSNRIYQQLGYRPVADASEWIFVA